MALDQRNQASMNRTGLRTDPEGQRKAHPLVKDVMKDKINRPV